MIVLTECAQLRASPRSVWSWFRDLDAGYGEWHPEHLTWRTLRGEPLTEGAVVFIDEWLGPLRLSGRSFIEDVESERHFAFRLAFPASMLGARGSFSLLPRGDGGCELVQRVQLGYRSRLASFFVDRAAAWFLPLEEIRRHMREEQKNLAAALAARAGTRSEED